MEYLFESVVVQGVVQSLIVRYLCKEPRLSGLQFSSEVRRCLVTELTLLPCVVIIHLTMWSMFRILLSKRLWALEIHGPKYGGGRLHREAIYMLYMNHRIIKNGGWALTQIRALGRIRNSSSNASHCKYYIVYSRRPCYMFVASGL